MSNPTKPDCSDAVVSGAPWDANRSKMDPSGTSQKFLAVMPHANTFDGGDGLNTAVTQWTWRGHSLGDYPLASGNTFDANRLQFNGKVDHNFNARHKVAVNYTNERIDSDYYNSRRGRLVARLLPAADAAPSAGVYGEFHVYTYVQHRQRSTVWVPEEFSGISMARGKCRIPKNAKFPCRSCCKAERMRPDRIFQSLTRPPASEE